MPVRRPCVEHRCPEYAQAGGSRCEAHQRAWLAGRWDKGLTGKRGSKQPGAAARRQVRKRQDGRCACCGVALDVVPARGLGAAWQLHHVDGDARNNDPSNWLGLCDVCHVAAERSKVPRTRRP